jgi:hypothetical protein
MPFIKQDVTVTQVSAETWKLLEPLVYEGREQTFRVPTGFLTDFASVPRIFFWLVPSYGTYTKAAVLHDYLLRRNVVSTADGDGIFRRSLRELRVPFFRRWMMWAAVRAHSRLEGITLADFLRWVAVFFPALALLAFPALIVILWLVLFWLIEVVFYFLLKPASRKRVNPPRFMS